DHVPAMGLGQHPQQPSSGGPGHRHDGLRRSRRARLPQHAVGTEGRAARSADRRGRGGTRSQARGGDRMTGRDGGSASPPVDQGRALPEHAVVPAVWGRITNLDVDRGEGSWLIARDGTRYLDYSSGVGVPNTGPAHPKVAAAIAAQAQKLLHGQQNIVYHEPGLRLYERLQGLLPGGPWQAFLSNSGAEAVEASVKLARVATGRPVILAFRGGFHGRTAQTMALTTA